MAYVSRHSLGATAADPLADVRAGSAFLKRGSKGDAVRALQTLLRKAQSGDDLLVVDGDFGPKTEALVIRAQKVLSLTADGIVGKQTITALEDALGSAVTATAAATVDFSARTPVKPLTRDEALKQARDKAKAASTSKVNAMRQKGITDAKAGKYAAPAPTAPPDFDTMNYQAGWLSTGAALPPGVVHIGAGGVPVTDAGGGGAGGGGAGGLDSKLLIAGGIAAAAVLFVVMRR